MSNLTAPKLPYIRYQCTCQIDNYLNNGTNTENIWPLPDELTLSSLASLYYCNHCSSLKCNYCVQTEPVCYYCPNCLFEVPTATVKAERNRCGRNCFECPLCFNTLTVTTRLDPDPASTSTSSLLSSEETSPHNPHYLFCGACRWNSLDIGLSFERPTGLAAQLQKIDSQSPQIREFDQLKTHLDHVADSNSSQQNITSSHSSTSSALASLPASLLASIPSLAALASGSSRFNSKNLEDKHTVNIDDYTSSTTSTLLKSDLSMSDEVMNVSSLKQRLELPNTQPFLISQLRPHQILLRTKCTKRCRNCSHILISPEPKSHSTKFKIRKLALEYVPKISILPESFPTIRHSSVSVKVALRFTNPLDKEVQISLTSPQAISNTDQLMVSWGNCKVNILAPTFSIGPFNELQKYEESPISPQNFTKSTGILEKKRNWICIYIEIIPTGVPGDRIEFGLMIRSESEKKRTTSISPAPPQTLPPSSQENSQLDSNINTSTQSENMVQFLKCFIGIGVIGK